MLDTPVFLQNSFLSKDNTTYITKGRTNKPVVSEAKGAKNPEKKDILDLSEESQKGSTTTREKGYVTVHDISDFSIVKNVYVGEENVDSIDPFGSKKAPLTTEDVINNKELMQQLKEFAKESSYAFQDEYCPSPFGESAKDSARRAEWETNPMSRWNYADGSEDFEDHDIMKSMLDEINFYYDSGSSCTQYKPKIDEYGYSSAPPARIASNSPFKPATYSYDAEFGEIDIKTGKPIPGKTTIVKQHVGPAPEQPVPDNQIEVKDWCNLKGLSLDERKEFLDGVQNIINKNNLGMDARTMSYSIVGGYASFDTVSEGYFGKVDNIKGGKLFREMIKDNRLMSLLQKSESVKRNHEPNTAKTQEYTIKVTDNNGNRLANDQILITSGDGSSKQIQMSVDEYKKLDRKEVTALLAS